MTTRDAARIGIRLLGLYGVVFAIGQLQLVWMLMASVARTADGDGTYTPAMLSAFSLIFSFAFAAFLLIRADSLARWLVPTTAEQEPEQSASITPEDAQAVGFSILGLFFVLTSLPRALQSLSQLSAAMAAFNSGQSLQIVLARLPRVVGQFLQLILGVLLFFQARALARMWHALRRAGIKEEEDGR